jgi:hypothetical protein
MPESVFTQTIPALLAGRACWVAAGFEAGAVAAELFDAGVAAGAGLLAGMVEAAGVAAGAGLLTGGVEAAGVGAAAAVEADSDDLDFFERRSFGAAVPLSADAVLVVAESSAAAAFFDLLFGLTASEVDVDAEVGAASLLSADADFFERLFLGVEEVELSAVALSWAAALFFELAFFFDVDVVELSAVAFSPSAADFLLVLFFLEGAPVSSAACEVAASAEAESAFFFFVAFFLVESVWL